MKKSQKLVAILGLVVIISAATTAGTYFLLNKSTKIAKFVELSPNVNSQIPTTTIPAPTVSQPVLTPQNLPSGNISDVSFGFKVDNPSPRYSAQSTYLSRASFDTAPTEAEKFKSYMILNIYLSADGYKSTSAPGFTVNATRYNDSITSVDQVVAQYYTNQNVYSVTKKYLNNIEWTVITYLDYENLDPIWITYHDGLFYDLRFRRTYIDEETIYNIASSFRFDDSPQPTVEIYSPVGGEAWKIGQTYTINYSVKNWSGPVKVWLERYHPTNSPKAGQLNSAQSLGFTDSKTSFNYTVDPIVESNLGLGGNFKIRICPGECGIPSPTPYTFAESPDYFSIEK